MPPLARTGVRYNDVPIKFPRRAIALTCPWNTCRSAVCSVSNAHLSLPSHQPCLFSRACSLSACYLFACSPLTYPLLSVSAFLLNATLNAPFDHSFLSLRYAHLSLQSAHLPSSQHFRLLQFLHRIHVACCLLPANPNLQADEG